MAKERKYKLVHVKGHKRQGASVSGYNRNENFVHPYKRRKFLDENYFGAPNLDFLKTLVTHSAPGEKKLQFPYEIPPIVTVITMDDTTKKILYTITGFIVGGIVVHSAINKFL